MVASCTRSTVTTKAVENEVASILNSGNCLSYDKKDYFNAIFFMSGPLVSHIGTFEGLKLPNLTTDTTKINQVRTEQAKVLDYIDSAYPAFLASFKSQVTSGNFDTVKAAITEGTTKYLDALDAIYSPSEDSTEEFATEFLTSEGEVDGLSTTQIKNKIASFSSYVTNTRTASSPPYIYKTRTVYVHTYFWLYLAAAAALAVVIVAVVAARQEYPDNPVLDRSSSFLLDDYVSDITANFSCSNPS